MYQFYTCSASPSIIFPWSEASHNLQLLIFLPYKCYIPNLIKIGSVVLEKKMLKHDLSRAQTHSNMSAKRLGVTKMILTSPTLPFYLMRYA